jgi:hypothetical protein
MTTVIVIIGVIIIAFFIFSKNTQKNVLWFREKQLKVHNPSSLGIHNVYVDSRGIFAFFFYKTDGTIHAIIGPQGPLSSKKWYLFDRNGGIIENTNISNDVFAWNLHSHELSYMGSILSSNVSHIGKIVKSDYFGDQITPEWAQSKAKLLVNNMDRMNELL